jgi:hypothetical protein
MKKLALTADYYKKSLTTLLFEQDEEAEEEPEEEAEEEGGEEEEEETEGGETSDPDSIDSELEALFIDFETASRKNVAEEVVESLSLKMLLEDEGNTEDIDLDHFSAEVARLVKNYENLLDMERIIVSKASSFITDKYGEVTVRDFLDKLESQHDIEITDAKEPPETHLGTPVAVGAISGE